MALEAGEFPIADGDEYKAGRVDGPSGLGLWRQAYYTSGDPVGGVLFIHGAQEHSSRYNPLLEELRERLNVNVYAYDQQGHGHSEGVRGLRGSVNKFEDYVKDAVFIARQIHEELGGKPLVLSGVSFGGLISCHLMNAAPELFVGMFLGAPLIDVEWTPILRIQAPFSSVLGSLCPDAQIVPAVKPEALSKVEDSVRAYVEDPLNMVGNSRAVFAAEVLKGTQQLTAVTSKFPAKNVAIVFGDADLVVSLKAAEKFIENIPLDNSHKALKIIPGMYHLLYSEPERPQVMEFMVEKISSWI